MMQLLHGLTSLLSQGTPDFMAVEYQNMCYEFLPLETADYESTNGLALCFSFHFLHDVESLYWIYLWFIHFRIPRHVVEREHAESTLATLDKWRLSIRKQSQLYFSAHCFNSIAQHPFPFALLRSAAL